MQNLFLQSLTNFRFSSAVIRLFKNIKYLSYICL